jgi:hypothetical protein
MGGDSKMTAKLESDGQDLYIVFNGIRIAKRGHPATPQAGTWVSLEPGYAVYSNADHSEIVIEKNGTGVQ